MARMSKMDYQLYCRMQEMFCPNESRHQAKQEYKDMMGKEETHNRTVGIHSFKTYDAYKQTSIEFSKYMKKEYKDIKDVRQVKEEHVVEYLQYRQQDEKSAYTISKDMAALNKLFNFFVTKKEAGIKERSYKDITRSRLYTENDKKYNPNNYKDQIMFAKACGCRRESVLVVTTECFTWKDGVPIKVHLIEKGGKERDAHILVKYQEDLKSVLENKEMGKPLFDRYTSKIDNHAFRREYAKNRYQEILGERKDDKDYRGHDKKVLKELTKDLGHNRLDVVVYNYLK
ncbi:site-specific integrase [Vallitaleaceae bacterium 9-2]